MKKLFFVSAFLLSILNLSVAQQVNITGEINFGTTSVSVVTLTPTGATTIYDLQSFGCPEQIWQNPNNSSHINAVFMCAPLNDPITFPNLRTKYLYSSNFGSNWTIIADFGIRSSSACITGLTDGRELVANTLQFGVRVFVDAFEGLGSFTTLDPEESTYKYPRMVATSSIISPVKYALVATTLDSCFIKCGTNLTPPALFLPSQYILANSPETYAIARGNNGRIGITFIASDTLYPNEKGNVYFVESVDGGYSFSNPIKIFQAIYLTSDTLIGAFKGINIVYQGSSPKVVFETLRKTTNGYQPTKPSQIRFWSPVLPGPDPYKCIIIADSSNVPFAPNVGVNDNLAPLCRPVIGSSSDSVLIYVAFMVSTSQTAGSTIPTSFRDIYFTYSANSNQWAPPIKISNDSIPRKDWTYPSMTPQNDKNGSDYFANLTVTADTIPGSYVNGQSNGQSLAKQMFARIKVTPSFNPTLPPAPILYHPVNGGFPQPRNPFFVWFPVYNATSYRLQISTNSSFTTLILNTISTVPYFLLDTNYLMIYTVFYWRVAAINNNGQGNWSTIWSFTTDNVPHYSVSGTVRYKDNNQIITSGYVKAIKLNNTNGAIITLDSCDVQPDGSYILPSVRQDSLFDISVYPNSTQHNDNFVPTYYPSTIRWENATSFTINTNLTNINIGAYRLSTNLGYNTIEGRVYKNSIPLVGLQDAVAYAIKDTTYCAYYITESDGIYKLKYLVPGTYKVFVNRFGYLSDSLTVILNSGQNINPLNFTLTSPFVGIFKNENIIPDSYALCQNYPNPFNPVTIIRFQIKDVRWTMLKVYDVLGREILTLVNEKLKPGYYNIHFDGTTLSSGVYFYKLVAGDFQETKKMILIK